MKKIFYSLAIIFVGLIGIVVMQESYAQDGTNLSSNYEGDSLGGMPNFPPSWTIAVVWTITSLIIFLPTHFLINKVFHKKYPKLVLVISISMYFAIDHVIWHLYSNGFYGNIEAQWMMWTFPLLTYIPTRAILQKFLHKKYAKLQVLISIVVCICISAIFLELALNMFAQISSNFKFNNW